MSAEQFKKIIKWLAVYYGKELSNETMMAYYLKFKDISIDRFTKACNVIVDTCEFFPSVARLKKELEKIPGDVLQLERKKYYIDDWDNPIELPSHEEIERELAKVLAERKAKNEQIN